VVEFLISRETYNLQNLLNFQNHKLQDFYNGVRKWIGVKRKLFTLVKPIARWYILRKSETYKKFKKNLKIKMKV